MRKIVYPPKKDNSEPSTPDTAPASPLDNLDIDALMRGCLQQISGVLKFTSRDIADNGPRRETVQNLKDVLGMLMDLKKREQEVLETFTDEQLEQYLRNK